MSLVDWAIILAPGLVFDFGWGYLARTIGLSTNYIYQAYQGRFRRKEEVFAKTQVMTLEPRLDQVREQLRKARDDHNSAEADTLLSELFRLRGRLQAATIYQARLAAPEYQPKISIVIPVHNGGEVIGETLEKLKEITYPDHEIVVVDDNSTDNTAEIVEKCPWAKLVRRSVNDGKKTGAINFGLNYTTGQVVVVVDDDTHPAPDSLEELVQPLQHWKTAAVGGNIRVFGERRNLLIRLQEIEYMKTMEMGRAWQSLIYGGTLVISGAFGAFNRTYLSQIGDYDIETITEDLDVTWKLYKLRRTIRFAHKAYADTDAPCSFRQQMHQRKRWDLGFLQTIFKHKDMIFNRKYERIGMFLLPESLIMELGLIVIKPFYVVILLVVGVDLVKIGLASFYFYLVLEMLQIATAALFSNKKSWALRVYYSPLMTFYYMYLGIVRWIAIISFVRGKEMKWNRKGLEKEA